MADKKIMLTVQDFDKLKRLIQTYKQTNRLKSRHLIQLAKELETAAVLLSSEIPDNIVTINSTVRYLDISSGKSYEVKIVFPADKDDTDSSSSILCPLGTSLIGEVEGAETICMAPSGDIPLKVEKIISQPVKEIK